MACLTCPSPCGVLWCCRRLKEVEVTASGDKVAEVVINDNRDPLDEILA